MPQAEALRLILMILTDGAGYACMGGCATRFSHARQNSHSLVATVGAAALVVVGLIGMAWILLGEGASNPLAFQTPLVVIPLITLFYGFISAPHRAGILAQ